MSPTRIRAIVAGVVAVLAALGIALPSLGSDDNSTATSIQTTQAQTTPQGSTVSTPSSATAPTSPTSSTTAQGGGSEAPETSGAGPDPSSEEGFAIARVVGEIDSGQSSQYSQDGTTFENREGHLPSEDYGYYREYTVLTPNSPDRGARRLILGEHGELYYTSDHYDSFTQIEADRYR